MKKFSLIITLFFLFLVPVIASAQPLGKNPIVPCTDNCQIKDFFTMLVNIYRFIVWDIATPLAIIALIVGGILMLISAGNPNLADTGRKILWVAVIGLILVFASYMIISFIMKTLGYSLGAWDKL
jgi:type IV secretory pathway VirB2 component (pilin)